MSSQDMQFADPEWQPPEERQEKPVSQTQEPPRPINANRLDQPQWQTTSTSQEEGYLGPGYAGPQPRTAWGAPSRSIPRRRSSPWRWLILAFIIIALMSGAFSRSFSRYSSPGPEPVPKEQVQNFTVATNTPPTIEINGGAGDITVSTSNSSGVVSLQESGPFGNLRDVGTGQDINTNTITVNDQGGVGLDVVVPSNAILQITTNDGSIDVEGVNLAGSSTLSSSGSGDITFNGSLSAGNYQFQSNSGSVDVTLQNTPNFSVNATTSSGSITTSGFPAIKNTGTQAQGSVGNASTAKQTTLTLTSQSGDITLSQSS